MSNSSSSEPEVTTVDDRLATLSSTARNVTLRLTSNQTRTKKENVQKIVSKNTATNVNRKEPLGNIKKEVLNVKASSNGNDELCETSVDTKSMIEEKERVISRNECSESPKRVEEGEHDLESSKITPTRKSNFAELSTASTRKTILVLPNSKQNEKYKTEVLRKQDKCSKFSKGVEPVRCNCEGSLNGQTNHSRTFLKEQKITKADSPSGGSSGGQKCSSPKQTTPSKKNSGQGSSAKPKIPFGSIRRRKSVKLGRERTFVRRKSFLKKGDGFSARRQLKKETKTTDTGRMKSITMGKKYNDNRERISLGEKKDSISSTFLLGETAGIKCSRKAVSKDTRPEPVIAKNKKVQNKMPVTVFDNSGSADPRSRRRWSENSVQTYEAMIFSTMFAFSEELKESSDIIYSKLQALYDSTSKTKTCSIFSKKSNGRSKEWRQNNRELLDSGSQEVAGTFSNLRKVESNLKTVDQAVSILLKEKSRTKERITGFAKPS